jgi:hypothetical protein
VADAYAEHLPQKTVTREPASIVRTAAAPPPSTVTARKRLRR